MVFTFPIISILFLVQFVLSVSFRLDVCALCLDVFFSLYARYDINFLYFFVQLKGRLKCTSYPDMHATLCVIVPYDCFPIIIPFSFVNMTRCKIFLIDSNSKIH